MTRREGVLAASLVALGGTGMALGQPVDFGDHTTWMWPDVGGFDPPDWQVTDGGATTYALGNIVPSIFYDDGVSVMNKRISGVMNPGTDDDVVGLVFGYTADDDFDVETGEYVILDWKASDQTFDWVDPDKAAGTFHDVTPGTLCRQGLRLIRATGVPTADELWGGVDLEENNAPPNAPGAAFELARADILGRAPYHNTDWTIAVDYTATNVKVWVDGVQVMDVDGDFPDGGFGVWEMAQDAADKPEQGLWTSFTIENIPGSPPSGDGFPFWTSGFAAANIATADPNHPPMGNETSIWTVEQTGGDAPWSISSPPNNGDFANNIGGTFVNMAGGVMLATVRDNRQGFDVAVAEVFTTGAFGGDNRGVVQIATAHAFTSEETNVDVAVSYFPFDDGNVGGHFYAGEGAIVRSTPGVGLTLENVESPDPNDQDGLWQLGIDGGRTPADGLLFTVGGSNEDNVTAATPDGDGWRVSCRDSGSPEFGGPTTFEFDDWSFVYLPIDQPELVGGFVTGFDGQGNADTTISAGDYELVREATGSYRLTVPGGSPEEGVLVMAVAEPVDLGGGAGIAPLNYLLSYEPDGDDFVIQQIELATINAPVDGAFAFAYLPFEPAGGCVADCDGNGLLNILDFVCFQQEWQAQTALGDCDGNGLFNILDFVCFQGEFQAGCP